MKCGDFGGITEAGNPCGRVAGWGRPGPADGPCRHHAPELQPLTPFQARFIDEFFVDRNRAAAYRRAGGSPNGARQNAHILWQQAHIQAAIQKRTLELREEVGFRQERVIQELAALAFSNLNRLIRWGPDEDGNLEVKEVFDSDDLDDATTAAVSEISFTQHGPKIKLHSKGDSLQKYMQHLGMLIERRIGIDIDPADLTEDELERIAGGEDPLRVLIETRRPSGPDE